jgi:hypothetical protein
MIKRKVMAFILIWMVHSIRAHGKMINSMDVVRRHGLTGLCMRVIMFLERNMEKVHLFGLMDPCTLVSSITIILKELVNINGLTAAHIMENGRIIKCMVEEFLIGQTVVNMKVTTSKIRSRVWAPSIGLMVASTWASGQTESSMVEELLLRSMDNKETENGILVNVLNGRMNEQR